MKCLNQGHAGSLCRSWVLSLDLLSPGPVSSTNTSYVCCRQGGQREDAVLVNEDLGWLLTHAPCSICSSWQSI